MISGQDIYHVISAMVPLYVAMGAGYVSIRYLRMLTPQQCAGINRYVALIAVPFLCFQVSNDGDDLLRSCCTLILRLHESGIHDSIHVLFTQYMLAKHTGQNR